MTQLDWSSPEYPEVDFARDEVPDLPVMMDELRSRGRFVPILFHGRGACLVTHYDDVKAALIDEETFPAAAAHREHTEPVIGSTMTTMVGQDHQNNRALVSPAFRPAVIRANLGPLLERLADELIDGFADQGAAELMSQYTRPMAFRTITRYVGIPVEDEPQILEWGSKLLRFAWDPQEALKCAARMRTYLTAVVANRRRALGTDLISELTRAEIGGKQLDDQEVVTATLALFAAGIDGPANVMGSLIEKVLSMPSLKKRVREEPSIFPSLIEETLRLSPSPALLPRKCPVASVWRDIDLPAGSSIIFGITPANRDPAAFPEPRRFDPDRRMDRSILTFGQGVHLCLGSHLTRFAMQIALRSLLERLPEIELDCPGTVEFIGGVFRGPRALQVGF